MEENKEVFVSEEEAIERLDKIDDDYKKKHKKEKHKKKEKSPKPRKPKYTRSGEKKTKKVLIIVLIVIIALMLIVLVAGALFFYFEKENLYKIEKDILAQSEKYYKGVNEDFDGTQIIIKNGSTKSKVLTLKQLPKSGVIKIDEDGVASYAIKSNNYCLVKNAYEKTGVIKKTKKCTLDTTATELLQKNNIFVNDDDTTGYDETLKYGSKMYVEGENPDNYIVFANRCFRIVNIANNGHIKAIYDGYYDEKGCTSTSGGFAMIERTSFDTNSNNVLSDENVINKLLNSYEENKTMNDKIKFSDDDFAKMANATWYVGAIGNVGTIAQVVHAERVNKGRSALTNSEDNIYSYEGKIGLINISDYLKASTNDKCNNMTSAYGNPNYDCSKENYLFLDGYPTWTMNAHNDNNNRSWRITAIGSLLPVLVSNDNSYIRPVIYIKGNVLITGKGTKTNPYVVE